jgi:peroxiredoxin
LWPIIPDQPDFIIFTRYYNQCRMNKLKVMFSIVVLTLIFWSCNKPNQFKIKGKITHADGMMIYLDELHVSRATTIDSTEIDKNGEFEIKGKTSIPTFYLLRLTEKNFITLLVDSAEVVTVQADEVNFASRYSVEGSLGSMLVNELSNKLNSTKQRLDSLASLNFIYKGMDDYPQLKVQLDEAYNKIVNEQVEFSTQFVKNNPFSMASVLALYQKFDTNNYVIKDLQSLKVVASALNSIYPQSEHVKALYANTLELVKSEKAAKMQQYIQENGSNSPDIVLPDKNGKQVALSSLRGKYVLLHFWSAKDRGSRIVNETLVELYRKFGNKGLEIYQVSIDDDKEAWIKAIGEDGLTWVNVGDMAGSTQAVHTYNIQEVPFNYLLDKDGVVIAKGLKGPNLLTTIGEYLK